MNKYYKLLTIKETANMIGLSKSLFYDWLRENKIVLKNQYNIPSDVYINKGWFIVNYNLIDNDSFCGVVPKVRITTKGFLGLENKYKKQKKEFDLKFEKAKMQLCNSKAINEKDLKLFRNKSKEVLKYKNKVLMQADFLKNEIIYGK